MSINNSILKLLNMKDKNLNFTENFVEERNIKNRRSLVIKAFLDKNPNCCPKCGCVDNIKKNGAITLKPIKIPSISGLNSYLEITKQLYRCNNCKHKITPQTDEVDYRCRISNNTKHSIIMFAKETITYKFIAKLHNVSDKTVQRQVNKIYDKDKLYKNYIPINICIDEFTWKKKTMAFNICDAETGKTLDLVEDRTTENLNKYFSYYLSENKLKVENVVMDMYKPYIKLVQDNFPNANIIIDMFHIVQLISRSLNKTRVQAMKKDKANYRKIKRYGKLLLKARLELDCSKWRKFLCFKNLMTEVDVVDYILNENEELKNTYDLYQNLLYALQRKDYILFKEMIDKEYSGISTYMQTSLNTLNEFSPYIKNTTEQPYSNGIMERNNNTCKLIKRIGFGYRNFDNFKARILIITNLFRPEKKNAENLLSTL